MDDWGFLWLIGMCLGLNGALLEMPILYGIGLGFILGIFFLKVNISKEEKEKWTD